MTVAAAGSDEHLVRDALGGDRRAADELLGRHYDRVYRVCRRITGNDADASDAAQEAMILVVRNLGRFDGRSSFSTWVYRIATNASLDELRRRRRRPTPGHDPSIDTGGHTAGHTEGAADHGAAGAIEAVADRMELDHALAGLPDEFRAPVVLRDVLALDYSEIASVLDIPLGTVKSRIARGRATLAAALRGNPNQPGERPTSAP